MICSSFLLQAVTAIFSVESVEAGIISDAASTVAGSLQDKFTPTLSIGFTGAGAPGAVNIALFLVQKLWMLVGAVAIFMIVRAGLKLITSQDDDKLNKAKTSIGSSLAAIMLAYVGPRLVVAFYTAGGSNGVLDSASDVRAGAAALSGELFGILGFIQTLVGALAVLMIVVSAVRAVGSFGTDDGPAQIRRSVFGAAVGIVMLLSYGIINSVFGMGGPAGSTGAASPAPAIAAVLVIVQRLFILLIPIISAVVIYAGFLMIVNLGNEEEFKKGRTLIGRALIGLLIIFLSYTFTKFITSLI